MGDAVGWCHPAPDHRIAWPSWFTAPRRKVCETGLCIGQHVADLPDFGKDGKRGREERQLLIGRHEDAEWLKRFEPPCSFVVIPKTELPLRRLRLRRLRQR